MAALNTFPRWKYALLGITLLLGLLYALPNLYGEDPAIQIGQEGHETLPSTWGHTVIHTLATHSLPLKSLEETPGALLIRFNSLDTQLKAQDLLKAALPKDAIVALNLAPATPSWLQAIHANPLKLGLDLRGGVHFLMAVDLNTTLQKRLELDNESQAMDEVQLKRDIVEQTIGILRNRINELGVAESVVQRQGLNHIVVELPGVQDTARAKEILGKTATLEFVMKDDTHDVRTVLSSGHVPMGSRLVYHADGRPVLVKKRIILKGNAITSAVAGFDNRDGLPTVNVRVGGGGLAVFKKATRDNVGKQMAVIYVETKMEGNTPRVMEKIISLATIQSALGSQFQITGLGRVEAQDLALLIRSGALPASVSIVEERTVGPSMGQENIRLGMLSMAVGVGCVLLFMALYYGMMGVIADIALIINTILLVAVQSMIGATLTLPGIAGIVLTMGMAVDANVLIFERIREELRHGMSIQASIHNGFEKAFSTILDSNLTTLIAAIILFSIGMGPVRGFAITLSLGLITSLFAMVTGARAMVNLLYGNRTLHQLPVGM